MSSQSFQPRSKLTAALRGFAGQCPCCGRGALLHRYLKPVERCSHCGEAYGHLRADDAPPWMTIFIVGHIVVPLLLSVEQSYQPPLWLHFALWPTLALALTLLLLPRCKGVILGMLWATGAREAGT
ncbi:DUF983 domain-containing protein [Azospirillum halopraeferens]|uniref:DUF983 domain-containing protein n=1 Tax=Azospirillum halopraeferens TaxID=34010 RepID=UPI00041D5BAE|nr:DUF983 domain-containing protein [Azospirillum halopraeferens]